VSEQPSGNGSGAPTGYMGEPTAPVNPITITQSTSLIEAIGKVKDSLARVRFGGSVLILLTLGLLGVMFLKLDGAYQILPVLGTGLGFLLGQDSSRAGRR
jgi:hypothetical protein